MNILTKITDRNTPVYIHVYEIIENQGTDPYNSPFHADDLKYFFGLSLTRTQREALIFHWVRE